MSWTRYLADRKVQRHATSVQELDNLRAVIDRDLADAEIDGLSSDRRFATAYNAALQIAKMVIACAGYRVIGLGHHQATFEAVELAMGLAISSRTAYFDRCRRVRNQVDYDMAEIVSDTEASEIVAQARQFREEAETWIAKRHPRYAASGRP